MALFSIAFLGHLFRLKIIDESSDTVLLKYGLKISQISQENTCAGHYLGQLLWKTPGEQLLLRGFGSVIDDLHSHYFIGFRSYLIAVKTAISELTIHR